MAKNRLEEIDPLNNDTLPTNNWGCKLHSSPFGLGLDLQTKYVWRGMEMMTQNSSPVIFPSLNYSFGAFFLYAMGGYAVNGGYAEVDLGLSYTWNSITIGFNDYYYPTIDSNVDYYIAGKNTGHWLEATLSYVPDSLPLWVTASSFFSGPDKYLDKSGESKQAYSSYVEAGTYYDFLENCKITVVVGAALNKSCYNSYEKDFSICNIECKYTYNVEFKNECSLPVSVSYLYNPVFNKPFVNLIANFAF